MGDTSRDIQRRSLELFEQSRDALHRRTDRLFGALLIFQFLAGVAAAIWLSPRTWTGDLSSTHIHLWAAIFLGAAITSLPLALITLLPGRPLTRYTVAVAQMLFSALLIHLSGGRIETHFHVFGSLAFLAFYRDWTVLIPATIVVLIDHLVRGIFWPESVFGVLVASPWRAFEHAGWVMFENIFLTYSCIQGTRELRQLSERQAHVEHAQQVTEAEVRERTRELQHQTEALARSEERFALAVRGSRDGIWDWDLAGDTIHYSPRWKELLGCADHEIGNGLDEWFSRVVSGHLAPLHDELNRHIKGGSECLDIEIEMHHADGNNRWMLVRGAAIRDSSGKATRLAGSLTDISELKETQEELRRMAQHDRLTGLPNRQLLTDLVRRAAARARRNPRHRFALLFFDFDRFKLINDSLGHSVGDALLVSIADRFRRTLRESDVAARFGGDEFVVLLDGIDSTRTAVGIADRFLNVFSEPHDLDGHEVVSSASIGIVTSDLDHEDADDMIRDADAAMYRAKSRGGRQACVFDSTMHAEAVQRLNLENDLRRATFSDQFAILYQPIVDLAGGSITAFEALLRWNHPSRGEIGPKDFIPIAEETGVINSLGPWTLRRSINQLLRWSAEHPHARQLVLNVNIARRQLIDPSFTATLREILEDTGLDPARLRLEITENTIMDGRHDLVALMHEIRDLGVSLAMDDFGTGHSSLSCLHSFPLDMLKLDRGFVRNMATQREFTAVVNSIVTLAYHLGLEVVAEGVEDEGQLVQLQSMECAKAQGFHFSPPVDAATVSRLLATGASFRHAA